MFCCKIQVKTEVINNCANMFCCRIEVETEVIIYFIQYYYLYQASSKYS